MKKKLLLCLPIAMALSLTSCDALDALFSFLNGDPSSPYTYAPSESYQPANTSLAPNEIEPKKGLYNYMDYVQNNVYAISSMPCVGEAHILVIPVWFSDSSAFISTSKKADVRKDIEKSYFGTNDETGWRSVKSFYEEESHGALTITGKVSEWYEVSNSYQYYATDSDTSRTTQLVKNATNWYFASNSSDSRANYDKDKDGYLDGVMFIYAAPDYVAYGRDSYTNLWAYCFWIQDQSLKNKVSPGPNVFFWASYDFMYSKSDSFSRCLSSSYGSGDTSHCYVDAHSYIHETGHMFGLEDYYDYSSYKYSPAAGFSMQDKNVGGHDAFSSFALGWGKAYMPTDSMTINLRPFSETGEMILLSPNNTGESRSPFDEYLLLEYYTPTGLNEFDTKYSYRNKGPVGVNAGGIRVWHVDARLIYYPLSNPTIYSITNNAKKDNGSVVLAMSNSYYDGTEETEGYLAPLGEGNYNYNILQLIRNNTNATYKPSSESNLSKNDLFKKGESFSMSKFSRQFVNGARLNDKSDLGFSFQVGSLYENFAEITITKL